MKASIIGSNGYIGVHLAFYLNKLGWDLYLYDVQEKCCLTGTFKYKSIDIREKESVSIIELDVDFVFYMAGITGTNKGFEHYELFVSVNEIGLLHLLDRVRILKNQPLIIFPSTRLVYKGKKNIPIKEGDEKEFKTLYALNKWTSEQLLQQYSNYFGIKYVIFRICVPFGNTINKNYSFGTIGMFLSKVLKGEPISLYGDGNLKRTFTYIEDLCTQIILTIKDSKNFNRIFNVAGQTFTLRKVAQLIADKYDSKIEYIEWPLNDLKLESGDTVFDSNEIRKIIPNPIKHTFENWINII